MYIFYCFFTVFTLTALIFMRNNDKIEYIIQRDDETKYALANTLQRVAGRCKAIGKPKPNTFPSGVAEMTVGHNGRARYSAGICWDLF